MFRVAPSCAVHLHRCAGRVGNYRRRDFVFLVTSCEGIPRLNTVAKDSTLMTVYAHTLLDASWQPDARLARVGAMPFGCGEAESRSKGVVRLYRITEQQPLKGVGTGGVGRRRKG